METFDKKQFSTTKDILVGYEIIGDMEKNAHYILSGEVDFYLRCCAFHNKHSRAPHNEEEILTEDIEQHVFSFKHYVRKMIQEAFNNIEKDIKKEQEKANKRFLEKDKPAPEGTVSELAEKLGLSKKKIRQLKRDGRLDEMLHKN